MNEQNLEPPRTKISYDRCSRGIHLWGTKGKISCPRRHASHYVDWDSKVEL